MKPLSFLAVIVWLFLPAAALAQSQQTTDVELIRGANQQLAAAIGAAVVDMEALQVRSLPSWLSRDANNANGPNPPFGHVADLIARHRRKVIAKEKLPYDGRRAGFCHLRGHPFEKLWLSSVES
jgi:hypothetical protein